MKNNLSKILGEKLLKVSDVHKKTGISKTTITNIYFQRAEDFKVSTLLKICDSLNVSLDEFFEEVI